MKGRYDADIITEYKETLEKIHSCLTQRFGPKSLLPQRKFIKGSESEIIGIFPFFQERALR